MKVIEIKTAACEMCRFKMFAMSVGAIVDAAREHREWHRLQNVEPVCDTREVPK